MNEHQPRPEAYDQQQCTGGSLFPRRRHHRGCSERSWEEDEQNRHRGLKKEPLKAKGTKQSGISGNTGSPGCPWKVKRSQKKFYQLACNGETIGQCAGHASPEMD